MHMERSESAEGSHLPSKALKAAEAGGYLADALGLPQPISEQGMWAYARNEVIPAIRLGRRIWFLPRALDDFIAQGGTAREKK